MAAKKTLEELRASAAARAKRWREKNRRKHRERVKAVYGRAYAQVTSQDGVLPEEVERYAKEVGSKVKYEPKEVQETIRVSLESVEADPEVMRQQEELARVYAGKRTPAGAPARNLPAKKVVTHTEEELGTYEKLVEMVERRKAKADVTVSLDEPGVSVEM